MAVRSSMNETVEFDDSTLANQLFGPHNAHLDLLAVASGARITSRGARILIESPDADVRQVLCNVFVQLYESVSYTHLTCVSVIRVGIEMKYLRQPLVRST